MTTAQLMLARACRIAAAAVISLGFGACAKDRLDQPLVNVGPYAPGQADSLWAVAPLLNETGVSTLNVLEIGDKLAAAIGETRGLASVPVNRTLAAMAARGIPAIRSPADAKALATAMGVDAIVVGTVTAWDPYDPPTLGLTLALYVASGSRQAGTDLDSRKLTSAYTDYDPRDARTSFSSRPAAVISEHLSAANHEVLKNLKDFAKGRHDPNSALTWKRYTASMELYTEFASWWCVRRLIDEERWRLAPQAHADTQDQATSR
jgi:hypothetical protein